MLDKIGPRPSQSAAVVPRKRRFWFVPTPLVAGVGLMCLGGFLMFGGGTFATRRASRTAEGIPFFKQEQHPFKPWIAGAALVGGLVLVFLAVGRGRHDDERGS
jgi:hypothetical protein